MDDDEDDFVLLRDLLVAGTGSIVVWARTHADALRTVTSEPFDVCLVDWRLGPDNGLELVAELSNAQPDIPTIVLTGRGDAEVDAGALAAGASDYLEKHSVTEAAIERSIRYAISSALSRAELRSSRQAAQQMIEALPIGVILMRLDGEILDVNQAALAIGGVGSLEALRGRPAPMYFSDSNLWAGLVDDLRESGSVRARTLDALTISGEPIAVRVTASLTSGEDGDTLILGTVEDVTEQEIRSRINQAYQRISIVLHRSDSLETGLSDVLAEACIATDAAYGEIWRPNDGRLALSGHFAGEPSLGEMASRSARKVFGPGEGVPGLAWSSGDVQIIDDIGTDDTFDRSSLADHFGLTGLAAIPIFGSDGIVAVLMFFNRDSHTVQASLRSLAPALHKMVTSFVARLRTQERVSLLLRILEVTPDLVLVLDSRGKVIYSNRAANTALGINTDAEGGGRSILSLASAEVLDHFRAQILPSLATEGSWTGELPISVGGESTAMSHVMLAHHDEHDEIDSISIVSRDLTEQHRTQAELQESNERLKALIETKEQFIAAVSHELRTPLTSVLGFSELLRGERSTLTTEQQEIIDAIADEANDLAEIIEDLLVAARSQSGSLAFKSVPVDLQAQARQVLETLRLADRISVDGDKVTALGDPGRVRQITRNLLTNAVRHGGPIIEVQTADRNDRVELTVKDNGPGIDYSDLERLFEMYQHAHVGTGRPGSLGIGLAVSRRLAEGMSGALEYRRTLRGSEFSLILPRFSPNPPSTLGEVDWE